ncbi:hypothetical protein I7I50_01249 [Histoplasma capsulatum G186AR]|uniref:Uncharacterized protein n=1 Tax=Ajellomyces capsulatus TaxID=5037 RepID=A0A8H7Z098_AJECA|nr:hypothetical protein I7I52_08924 [Histoplasma capsulatum]QSS73179.1 hypothetical protein I7I50_01249 [Histoplasma capsulatum G186AR]
MIQVFIELLSFVVDKTPRVHPRVPQLPFQRQLQSPSKPCKGGMLNEEQIRFVLPRLKGSMTLELSPTGKRREEMSRCIKTNNPVRLCHGIATMSLVRNARGFHRTPKQPVTVDISRATRSRQTQHWHE